MKKELYQLAVINRDPINNKRGIIKIETKELIFEMPRGHIKYTRFNLILIGKYKIILGML